MFNILKYAIDQVSGSVEVKVIYQSNVKAEVIHDGGTFSTKESADKWLYNVKKLWLGIKLDNFLLHKRHILQSATGHKSVTQKREKLDELFRFAKWLAETATLNEACKWLLKEAVNLEYILPGTNNPSRDSSEKELRELLNFASAQLSHTLLKKAS